MFVGNRRRGCLSIAICLCSSLSMHQVAQAEVLVGPVINQSNGHQYYLLDAASWSASERQAKKLGGHLVTIDDRQENEWVCRIFSTYGNRPRNLWTGLADARSEGSMEWVSGQKSNYTNWVPGEPNNASGVEDCVAIWSPSGNFH